MVRQFTLAIACAGATLLGIVATPADAATFNLTDLVKNPSNGFTIGDKLFNNFTSPNPDSVTLTTLDNSPVPGFYFSSNTGGLLASTGQVIDRAVTYNVTALGSQLISDIHLSITPTVNGDGRVSVGESVEDPNSGFSNIGFASVSTSGKLSAVVNLNYPVKTAEVLKDISLFGGTTSGSFVDASIIEQHFSQTTAVPEPDMEAGLLVFGLGGIGLILKRQRYRAQS